MTGDKFHYYEDHTKAKHLGDAPLELATWNWKGERGAGGILELHTVGRDDSTHEAEGRSFFFKALNDTDVPGLLQAMCEATYLRNRNMFLEALLRGDHITTSEVGVGAICDVGTCCR